MKKNILIISAILLMFMSSFRLSTAQVRLFAGAYTKGTDKGLFVFDLDAQKGTFKLVSSNDAGPNPSYFCISKKNGFIYAANEVMKFNGIKGGGVTALQYDAKTGIAKKMGDLAVPNGGPAYISISPDDGYLFLANYSGGSVSVVKLDGKGIPVKVTDTIVFKGDKGKVSHAHMVAFDPSGKRVYLTDLGLDHVVIYNFDAVSGKLHQIPDGIAELPKGSGPRHFVFNADGSRVYVINELNSTIAFFSVNSKGELHLEQIVSTLREGFAGKSLLR